MQQELVIPAGIFFVVLGFFLVRFFKSVDKLERVIGDLSDSMAAIHADTKVHTYQIDTLQDDVRDLRNLTNGCSGCPHQGQGVK